MSEYYCTKCGADLGEQYGFEPEKGYWICTDCGTLMTDPDDADFDTPSGATWFCDGCGACLNKQFGFSEYCSRWDCTECGYENRIDEDEIYDSEEDYQNSKEDNDSDDDETSENEDDSVEVSTAIPEKVIVEKKQGFF